VKAPRAAYRAARLAPALLALFALLALSSCSTEVLAVRRMAIASPSLAAIADGSYEGRYAYGHFEYAVRVSMKDHRIEGIEILANRDTGPAQKAEGVLPRILEKQSPDVDAVAGATTTSKALMKAVENALLAAAGH
jgi:uncharacterized protein with FMN-binding domain